MASPWCYLQPEHREAGTEVLNTQTGQDPPLTMKILRIARPAVSIIFILVLFFVVEKGDLSTRFRHVNLLFLMISLGLIPLMILLNSLRWKVLLDHQGYRISVGYLMKMYFIGYLFSNLLPSDVGGDLIRSYYAGRKIGDQTAAAASVLLDRFSGLLILLILTILAPFIVPGLYGNPAVYLPAAFSFCLMVVVIYLLRRKVPLTPAERIVNKESAWGRLYGYLREFRQKLNIVVDAFKEDRRILWKVFSFSVVIYLLRWVNVYFAFLTFSVQPDFVKLAAVIPTIMLVSLIPISQGSIGLAEGAHVFYFSLIGIDVASSLAMALFMRFKLLVAGGVGAVYYLAMKENPGRDN